MEALDFAIVLAIAAVSPALVQSALPNPMHVAPREMLGP